MIRVGKIAATHGLQGTLILTHVTERNDWLQKGHVLFVELQKGSRIPYFVERVKAGGAGELQVGLEDVATVEAAKKLVGKHVYVDAALLGKASENTPLLWIGFNVVDAHKGGIGPLADVTQAGPQWIGTIISDGREILIPLVPQMIIEVNARNKYIRMDLPEGLLDI